MWSFCGWTERVVVFMWYCRFNYLSLLRLDDQIGYLAKVENYSLIISIKNRLKLMVECENTIEILRKLNISYRFWEIVFDDKIILAPYKLHTKHSITEKRQSICCSVSRDNKK